MFLHSTILGPIYWMISGVVFLFALVGMKIWAEDLKLNMNWWKWVLVIGWFMFAHLTIAGGFTLIGEREPKAGFNFLIFFGIFDIIAAVVIWRLISMKGKKKLNNAAE